MYHLFKGLINFNKLKFEIPEASTLPALLPASSSISIFFNVLTIVIEIGNMKLSHSNFK